MREKDKGIEKDPFKEIMSSMATNASPLDSIQMILMETIFTNLDQYQQTLKNTSALKLIRTFITAKMDLDKAEKYYNSAIATRAISTSSKPVYKSNALNNIVNIFCNAFMGYVFAIWQNGSELESSNTGIAVNNMLLKACEKIVGEVSEYMYNIKTATDTIGYRGDSISTATTGHNISNGSGIAVDTGYNMGNGRAQSADETFRPIRVEEGCLKPIKADLSKGNVTTGGSGGATTQGLNYREELGGKE